MRARTVGSSIERLSQVLELRAGHVRDARLDGALGDPDRHGAGPSWNQGSTTPSMRSSPLPASPSSSPSATGVSNVIGRARVAAQAQAFPRRTDVDAGGVVAHQVEAGCERLVRPLGTGRDDVRLRVAGAGDERLLRGDLPAGDLADRAPRSGCATTLAERERAQPLPRRQAAQGLGVPGRRAGERHLRGADVHQIDHGRRRAPRRERAGRLEELGGTAAGAAGRPAEPSGRAGPIGERGDRLLREAGVAVDGRCASRAATSRTRSRPSRGAWDIGGPPSRVASRMHPTGCAIYSELICAPRGPPPSSQRLRCDRSAHDTALAVVTGRPRTGRSGRSRSRTGERWSSRPRTNRPARRSAGIDRSTP